MATFMRVQKDDKHGRSLYRAPRRVIPDAPWISRQGITELAHF